MQGSSNRSFLIVALAIILLAVTSVFTVQQYEQAIVLRMGKILTDNAGEAKIYQPGLHIKMPLINQVRSYDIRLQTLAVESSRILTENQKYVLVDYYAKWRIADLPEYYRSTGGDAYVTDNLLQQKINDALRAAFGKRSISEVISGERTNIMELLKNMTAESAKGLGVEVLDVRIKRIDLPKEVSESVFQRMRAEREQVAEKHRSDGKKEAEKIRSAADASVTVTLETAKAQAASIEADGLRQASSIYANAYNKDLDFYEYMRSLESYKRTMKSKDDFMLLSPEEEFFKFFVNPEGTPEGLAQCRNLLTEQGGKILNKFIGAGNE